MTDEKQTRFQFQIGDPVVYKPEGVLTQISGYLWRETIGGMPTIGAYALDCGITVPFESIRPAIDSDYPEETRPQRAFRP